MSDSESKATPAVSSGTAGEPSVLDAVTVFFALGSETRLPIVKLLTDGCARSISEIRDAVGSTAENISKQLRVLQDAGILEARKGDDRRQQVFSVPAAYRATPGVLEFGCCTVKL